MAVLLLLLSLSEPVACKDLMIDFWSPNLNHEPFEELFVNAGDTVTFKVYGPHTVFIHPSLSCDPTNRNELVPKDHSVTYTFQERDSGFFGNEMLFVCDAGTHCSQGQQARFRVFPAPQPPTPAPTLSPTVPKKEATKLESELSSGVKELEPMDDESAGATVSRTQVAVLVATIIGSSMLL